MRILAGFLGLAVVLALSLPPAAEAAPPPRVAPQSCGGQNVWHTWFQGSRKPLFGPPEWYTASPCFKTAAACKAWLYWAQTDWPRQNTFRPCWKG